MKMTNRVQSAGEAAISRPMPVVPVAKPRGKTNNQANNNSSTPAPPPSSSSHYANQTTYGAVPKTRPSDTDTMTKTKAILNEAADAVAKSFAKQTQGINKGKDHATFIFVGTVNHEVRIWLGALCLG